MSQQAIGNFQASWSEYGADEWADALVASMKLGGVHSYVVLAPGDGYF